MREEQEQPRKWEFTPLEQICEILDSIRIPVNATERAKRTTGKGSNELYPYYGATGQVGEIDGFLFDGEYVLIGEDGAPFLEPSKDTAYIVSGKFWVNNHAHILKSHISNKYLRYYLNQVDYSEHVTGTTRLKLNQSALRQIPIAFAPENEQRRIVAKIEELFSELDKGVESLKTARAQLKTYRQAVLKHAFEGKLTEKWREENKDTLEPADSLLERIKSEREAHYLQQLENWQQEVKEWEDNGKIGRKPTKPKINGLCKLISADEVREICSIPENWCWIHPEDLASPTPYSIGIGPFGSNLKVCDYRAEGVPLIFVRNITRDNFSLDLKFIEPQKAAVLVAHTVEPLDLVITKMGDPPGDCQVYPKNSQKAVLTADCLKFRVWNDHVERDFYKYCIWSNHVKKQLGLITKGVAQKKISVDRFKTIALPLPSKEEQKQVVAVLENIFSQIKNIEQEIETELKKSEALRQSILKKAFSGQLVSQDPNDEPASILLERISAEKTAQATAKAKAKKKTKRKTAA